MENLTGKRFKVTWHDGFTSTLICEGRWRLEGQLKTFESVQDLEKYYEATITSFVIIKAE